MVVVDVLGGWYDSQRRHSALGCRFPNALERELCEIGCSAPEPPIMSEKSGGQKCPAFVNAWVSTHAVQLQGAGWLAASSFWGAPCSPFGETRSYFRQTTAVSKLQKSGISRTASAHSASAKGPPKRR